MNKRPQPNLRRTRPRWARFLEKRGIGFIVTAGILLASLIAVLDYLSGPEISSSLFYVIQIAAAGWYGSRRAGYFLAVFSSLAWFLADLGWDIHYTHHMIPVWNALVRLGLFLLIVFLLCELRDMLQHQERLALTDQLTGLCNGRCYYQKAEIEIRRLDRFGHPFTLAYVDLDNFKQINDLHGRAKGDDVLVAVADILRSRMRSVDTVARLGGDEFAILLPETALDAAVSVIRKLRSGLREEFPAEEWPLGMSMGAVVFEKPPRDAQSMTAMADRLMYQVKNEGKDGFVVSRWDGESLHPVDTEALSTASSPNP